MAIVGQLLASPEEGWKRIQNQDPQISYVGNGWQFIKNTYLNYVATDSIHFKFTGSKIRVIGAYDSTWAATKVNITIDGVSYIYDQSVGGTAIGKLVFEKNDLQNGEHNVVITGTASVDSSHYFGLYAIDVDGTVTPPTPTGDVLLRVTMNDSSEREYQLSTAEIDNFVKWFNRTIGTGTTGYVFNKTVQNSKEYLSFEKIISFQVIPLK